MRTIGRRAALVVGAIVVTACSSDGDEASPTTTVPASTTTVPSLALPTHTFADGGVADLVEGEVSITVIGGVVCVTVADTFRGEEVLVIWPPGFTAAEQQGSPMVLTANGAPVELVDGEARSIGGGVIPAEVSPEAASCPELPRFVVNGDMVTG